MKPIVLIGMPGAGKTSVSKKLGEKLGFKVFDIDSIIENSLNAPIAKIFEEYGEKYFRKIEEDIIVHKLIENSILSLGGGAFESKTVQELLLKKAIVVYLKVSINILSKRLQNDTTRPLLSKGDLQSELESLLAERCVNYNKAHIVLDIENKNVCDIAEELIKVIKNV